MSGSGGSEDGQLSPNHNDFRKLFNDHPLLCNIFLSPDGDTDSLDIKPPQAIKRDASRKHKSSKNKKHSRERRKEREYDSEGVYNKHDRRNEDRKHRNSDGNNRREPIIISDTRADQRYFHRNPTRNEYHQREFQPPQQQRNIDYHQQQDYHRQKQRGSSASQIDRIPLDKHYHQQHQQQQQQQQQRSIDPHRDRSSSSTLSSKKYFDGSQSKDDAERALEDLRSRLLSKRNKYEKEIANRNYDDHQQIEYEKSSRGNNNHLENYEYRSKERIDNKKHSRKSSPENVIELIDSPDREKEKRKEHKKLIVPKIEDPELLARRAKLLEAEKEMARRREELEARREELEARRELKRLKDEAAEADIESMQFNVVTEVSSTEEQQEKKRFKKKKRHFNEAEYREHYKKKKLKREDSPMEEGEYEDERRNVISENESEISLSSEEQEQKEDYQLSDVELHSSAHKRHKNKKKRRKHKKQHKHSDDGEYEENLQESPLSICDLSKSPDRQQKDLRSSRSVSHSDRSVRSRSDRKSDSRTRSEDESEDDESDSNDSEDESRSRSHSSYSEDDNDNEEKKAIQKNIEKEHSEEDVDMKEVNLKTDSNIVKEDDSPRNEKGEKLANYYPGVQGCRSVEEFQCLNRIEEGTYGVVYRAKDKRTNEIVALKRLKMEKEKDGFPITSLREINTLLKGQHPNIVTVREIVVGSNMDKIFIVMDYVEHDLKSLMETMKHKEQSFFPGEVKCLTEQLLRAVGHLHDNWILHRDLKASNLLLSHKGILKVGDFGLAREYGSPLKAYTSLVVTLWYRAPELLLCTKEYSTPIDMWSVGCIFAEFLQMGAIFPGKSEIDQLNRIFKELGTPNEKIWPGYKDLPAVQNLLSQNPHFTDYPVSNLRKRFINKTTELGIKMLQGLLTYDPKQRFTAEQALKHSYFQELPLSIDPSMFPTWPAKSELGARKALASSPKPPSGGSQFKQLGRDELISSVNAAKAKAAAAAAKSGFILNAGIDQRQLAMGPGFNLKF